MPHRASPVVCRWWLYGLVLVPACDDARPTEPIPEPWPMAMECEPFESWPSTWTQLEHEAFERINQQRQRTTDCAERGTFAPAPALVRGPALDCAARFHAEDMANQGYFGHRDPSGADERDRVEITGYSASHLIEHIARGPGDATVLVDQLWLPRPVPCSSLSSADYTQIGLGNISDIDDEFTTYWVVLLASPGAWPTESSTTTE